MAKFKVKNNTFLVITIGLYVIMCFASSCNIMRNILLYKKDGLHILQNEGIVEVQNANIAFDSSILDIFVHSRIDGMPKYFANITIFNSDTKYTIDTSTNENGAFVMQLPSGLYFLAIKYMDNIYRDTVSLSGSTITKYDISMGGKYIY